MLYNTFKIRPLLRSEVDEFITANIKAGFISSDFDETTVLKKGISLAEHIGIVEAEKVIKGGIMVFRRWHDAIWVTNIFVDASIQTQGASTALYKYVVQYCSNKQYKWAFCNPVDRRIALLHQRWGILPTNSWESVSLVALYNHFVKSNVLDIQFPFRVASENNILKAENEDMILQLIPNKQLLEVRYKQRAEKSKGIPIPDVYKLCLHAVSSHIKLPKGWLFDSSNGLIVHKHKQIIVYTPTATSQNFAGLNIPIDDVKAPESWKYSDNSLHVIYNTLEKNVKVELLATFTGEDVKLEIRTQENFIPRLTIEQDLLPTISLLDNNQTIIDKARYKNRQHTIYHGLTNQFVIHLEEFSAIHKKYLRSFIPRSHRPYIRGIHAVDLFSTLPLAAAILDDNQRKLMIDSPNTTLELSDEGNNMLNEIKTYLYADR